jgi:acyl-CoA thioester hydrolase
MSRTHRPAIGAPSLSLATTMEVEIRWSDVDAYGHVSHIAIVALAEHARSRWLDAVLETEDTWDYAIARLEIDYRAPLLFADRVARVELAAERVGTSSVTLRETVSAPDGRAVAEIQCVAVAWDAANARSRPLTDAERAKLSG